MARPIWNGTISFGLLNVPVQLYSGERSVDLHLRMLDSRDKSPIRYERINSDTGEEVPWKDIVKAFEYSKGSYVVIDEEALRKAHPESTESVEIEAFVKRDSIDPRYFEKPYYLVPGKKAEKGYVLLREILQKSGRVGIAKVVIRTRQYLAALMPEKSALILNLLRFPQELIEADEFALPSGSLTKYRITPKELQMAEALVESMSSAWNPADYKDDFRQKLRKIVEAQVARKAGKKVNAGEEKVKAQPGETTNVVDFMALLKKSLEGKAKRSKSESKPKRKTAASR
ncbi:MAG: Ku protein [Pseudomonadota bacterium]